MTYSFEIDPESGIILVIAKLDGEYEMKMALDTAASRTTFDFNALHVAGYAVGDITETGLIETANGIVKVGIFEIDNISALGHTLYNKAVQVYDYLAHGILSDYDGVLGIDFFKNTKFTIDMINQTIEILEVKN